MNMATTTTVQRDDAAKCDKDDLCICQKCNDAVKCAPPLPDDVREAVTKKLKEVRHLIDEDVRVALNTDILEIIRAATQQPEVVTVEQIAERLHHECELGQHDKLNVAHWLEDNFPHGLKIVEG